MKDEIREYMAANGKKGGSVTGKSKNRGTPEYYAALGKKGGASTARMKASKTEAANEEGGGSPLSGGK